jgi:hypothetical protein
MTNSKYQIPLILLFCAPALLKAQPPDDGPGLPISKRADVQDLVSRMMAFDANKDGTLTRDEVTDRRLLRLFDRADVDKGGVVTKDELAAVAEKEHAEDRGGPPGFGPPGFRPPGGGPGGPPWRPGQVLPRFLQEGLGLSSEQRAQVEALQKEVDARLDKILTESQRRRLGEMRPGGPGGMGFPGRRGRPGGGPPPGGGTPPD